MEARREGCAVADHPCQSGAQRNEVFAPDAKARAIAGRAAEDGVVVRSENVPALPFPFLEIVNLSEAKDLLSYAAKRAVLRFAQDDNSLGLSREPPRFVRVQHCHSGGASRNPQNGIANPITIGTRIEAHIGTLATRRMM